LWVDLQLIQCGERDTNHGFSGNDVGNGEVALETKAGDRAGIVRCHGWAPCVAEWFAVCKWEIKHYDHSPSKGRGDDEFVGCGCSSEDLVLGVGVQEDHPQTLEWEM
jgi:hypothetical protein